MVNNHWNPSGPRIRNYHRKFVLKKLRTIWECQDHSFPGKMPDTKSTWPPTGTKAVWTRFEILKSVEQPQEPWKDHPRRALVELALESLRDIGDNWLSHSNHENSWNRVRALSANHQIPRVFQAYWFAKGQIIPRPLSTRSTSTAEHFSRPTKCCW